VAKNVLPKYWNGSEFEELHIVTKASNVFTNDNKSAQQKIDDFTSHLAAAAPHSGHETPAGAQEKANIAETNAKNYTDEHDQNTTKHITATERTNWNDANAKKHTHSNKSILDTITQTLINTWNSAVDHISDAVKHITSAERTRWNNKAEVSQIPTKVSQLENDRGYVTQEELGDAGYGDMLKSIYDTDNDGKVDMAEAADSVPWTGVIGKPGTFPPSSHTHIISNITGLQVALDGKMSVGPLTWNDLKGVI